MLSDARLRANAKYQAKLKAAGYKSVMVLVSPEAQAAWDALAVAHGGRRAALEKALIDAAAGLSQVAKVQTRAKR